MTVRVGALNRFIARSSERCKPFYDLLRKSKDFQWTTGPDKAFEELKAYLSSSPLLAKVEKGDPLSLYVFVTEETISAVLVKDIEGQQHPLLCK